MIITSRWTGGTVAVCGRRQTGTHAGLGVAAAWWDGFPIAFALTCIIELPAYLGAFGVARLVSAAER